MTRTRRTAKAAPLAVFALVVAACGGSASFDTDLTGEASGEVTYWLWDSNQLPAYDACAKKFMAQNPDIDVTIEQYGWDDYWAKLQAGFLSETAPDVFTNHVSKYPQFAEAEQMVPLNPAVQQDDIDLGQYQDGLTKLWVDESGDRYGLPKDWDTVGIVYNKKMADEGGVTAGLDELTWNPDDGGTFEETVAHLTVDENGVRGDEPGFDKDNVAVYGLGYPTSGGWFGQTEWSMYALSTGWNYTDKNPWGRQFNYADPRFVDTIDWMTSLIDKGYAPPLEAVTSGVGMNELLAAGEYAMVMDGDWNINGYLDLEGFNPGFAPTPIGPSGERASIFNGLADSIYIGSDNKPAAWEWVKFLASPRCQDIVASQAIVFPAVKSSLVKAEQAFKKKGVDTSAFTVHVRQGTTHLAPITFNSEDVEKIMGPQMERVFLDEGETEETLQDANEQVNNLFE